MGYKLTDEYLMSKTFLLKTKELNINEEDFNTLSECTKGIEPKACTTDNITVKEANEARVAYEEAKANEEAKVAELQKLIEIYEDYIKAHQ